MDSFYDGLFWGGKPSEATVPAVAALPQGVLEQL